MINKFKEFFIKENNLNCVTPWYHGLFYYNYEKDKIITILLIFAPFVRLLRLLYLHSKFGNYDLRTFYKQQEDLRKK